jgi:hypothetical protein
VIGFDAAWCCRLLSRWCCNKAQRRREQLVRILHAKHRGVRLGLSLAVAATAVLTLVLVAPGLANLAGSTFEGNDGNLVVNTAGNQDWSNAPNRVVGLDQPSGGSDNSFGQGTKEDDPNVKVVTGSIPPNKNDLTRFYIGSDFTSNSNFLYLAWERAVNIGSANMDLEINQNVTTGFTGTTTGPVTLNRTAGDLLITYDFSGSGTPTLGLLKWVTTGATSQCFSSNALPCWGNRVNLSAAGFAEGAVNTATVADPVPPGAPRTLTTGLFGEAAINLTAAGVFPAGTCEAFGSAFLKSRSSSSFPAEVKDFIAPQPVNISNCGTIKIHKVTENGDATFGYTTTGGLSPATFNLSNGGTRTYGPGTVLAGNYSVTESTIPAGWTLKDLTCTASGSGTSATPSGATVAITMAGGGIVDCTYTNHINLSPTIATTLSDSSVSVGATVHDSATLSGTTSDAGGTVTYTVYTDDQCTQNPRDAGTKTVTNGTVPDSNSLTFDSAGTFYWQAVYSGDANNNPAMSACTSETLVVNKAGPSIATTLSDTTVSTGTAVHDSATLTGTTSDAGGTVTYTVYTDDQCTQNPQGAGTKTVTNGTVPDSDPITFNSAGDFYWQAVYSGDANNTGATSVCTSEHLVVTKNQSALSTAQNLLPNDNATLSGATSNAGGTITFDLFSPSDATCSGTPALTQTVNVNGNGTYSTTNTTFLASDEGTWRWQVTYSGDANNEGSTSACGVERFTITNQ